MDCEEGRLHLRPVPERFCLTRDSGPRQCQVAQVGARGSSTRKSEDVGHLVIAEEPAVQPPQLAISRDTHRELGCAAHRRQRRGNLRLGRRGRKHPTHEARWDGCPDRLHDHHTKTDN